MRNVHIPLPTPLASGQLDFASGRVTWWGFRETTGTASAVFRLWDSSTNAGKLLVPFTLSPNESTRDVPGWHGLVYETGLFFELVSGTVEGALEVVNLDHGEDYGVPVVIIGELDVNVINQ